MLLQVDFLHICLTNDLPIGKKRESNVFGVYLYPEMILKCTETGQFSVHSQDTTTSKRVDFKFGFRNRLN